VKTEPDSDDDIIECLHDDKPTIGTLCLSLCHYVSLFMTGEVCSTFVSCLYKLLQL